MIKLTFFQIDSNDPSRLDKAFLLDNGLRNWAHAGLGTDSQNAVFSDGIAHGPQAIAIQARHTPAAIISCERGGSVPRFHHAVAIFVKLAPAIRHEITALGIGFRDQKCLGQGGDPSSAHQEFENSIKSRRVG